MTTEKLMNIDEVAELLGVKKSTVYSWTHEQTIPHIKVGRLIRFRLSDIQQWVEKHRVPARTRKEIVDSIFAAARSGYNRPSNRRRRQKPQ